MGTSSAIGTPSVMDERLLRDEVPTASTETIERLRSTAAPPSLIRSTGNRPGARPERHVDEATATKYHPPEPDSASATPSGLSFVLPGLGNRCLAGGAGSVGRDSF
ncbi:MAG: hypothetical protein CME06_13225 [Gemmatimonadetes bacterium]|nr:hypothetical protein [Gemmatimonadota bacterium]